VSKLHSTKNFEDWLKLQLLRDDPIGDFARDYQRMPVPWKSVMVSTEEFIDSFEAHLKDTGACCGVIAVFMEVMREYTGVHQ